MRLPASLAPSLPAIALCAFAYLYVFPYQSSLNNPNENVRLYMTAALVEEGRYEIDGMRERWGWVNDAAVHEGHHYSVKAPGTSFAGVPAYAAYLWLGKLTGRPFDRTEALWCCRLLASILPTLLGLWFFHGWLSRQSEERTLRDAVFFSVALGSLLYGYGMLFVSHTVSAIATLLAFGMLYDARHAEPGAPARGPRRAFAAGLATAGITLLEYPGLVASLGLAGYGLWIHRRARVALAAFVAGGLPPTALMMHFQNAAFGSPFTPGHLMVETDALRERHHEGLYGAVGPSAEALHGLVTDLGAGLLPLTPILVLSLPGFVLLLRDRRRRLDAAVALGVALLTLFAIASMNNWRGGWTVGPRYLALAVPLLAWPTLVGLEWLQERAPLPTLSLALGFTSAGMLASGLPGAYYPHLPPELTRPLPQLFAVLVDHGFAPRNAGALFGWYGTASMLPLLVCAVSALGLCLRSLPGWRERSVVAVAALLFAVAANYPLTRRPAQEPGVPQAVAFITRRWTPEGHDDAARLRARLRANRSPHIRDLQRLARLYEREGRVKEARRALRGQL